MGQARTRSVSEEDIYTMKAENRWIEASKLLGVLGLGAIEAALFVLVFGACGDDSSGSMTGPDATLDSSMVDGDVTTDASMDASDISEVCIDLDCGNGTCIDAFGEAACRCEGNFADESCDSCALGYALPDCEACAIGYKKNDDGICVENPCGGVTCSDRGECVVYPTGDTECICRAGSTGANCQSCDTGYVGDSCTDCDAGYSKDGDKCVPTVCVGNDCDGHGTCVDSEGAALCECDEGYQGRACTACAAGFVDDGNGTCIPDVCEDIDCGPGKCVERRGNASCDCPDGFIDEMCTTCSLGYTLSQDGSSCDLRLPPITTAMPLAWHDGADPTTMIFSEPGKVATWRNKLGTTGGMVTYATRARPDYVLFDRAVRMNGTSNFFYSYVNHVGTADYVIYMVLKWDAQKEQWLWRTHHNIDDKPEDPSKGHGLTVKILANGNIKAEHRHDFGDTPGDVVEADFFTHGKKQLLKISRQPFLNGKALVISNGSQSAQIEMTEPAFNHVALSTIGCDHSDFGGELFDGDLHEIVTIHGTPSAQESKAIEDYLRVKWSL